MRRSRRLADIAGADPQRHRGTDRAAAAATSARRGSSRTRRPAPGTSTTHDPTLPGRRIQSPSCQARPLPAKGPMVLAGAGRPGRAVDGDVDLVDRPPTGRRDGERAGPTGPAHMPAPTTIGTSASRAARSSSSIAATSSSSSPIETIGTPSFQHLLGERGVRARAARAPRHPPCRAWPTARSRRVSTATTSTSGSSDRHAAFDPGTDDPAPDQRDAGSSRPIGELERAPAAVLRRRAARAADAQCGGDGSGDRDGGQCSANQLHERPPRPPGRVWIIAPFCRAGAGVRTAVRACTCSPGSWWG